MERRDDHDGTHHLFMYRLPFHTARLCDTQIVMVHHWALRVNVWIIIEMKLNA